MCCAYVSTNSRGHVDETVTRDRKREEGAGGDLRLELVPNSYIPRHSVRA